MFRKTFRSRLQHNRVSDLTRTSDCDNWQRFRPTEV